MRVWTDPMKYTVGAGQVRELRRAGSVQAAAVRIDGERCTGNSRYKPGQLPSAEHERANSTAEIPMAATYWQLIGETLLEI